MLKPNVFAVLRVCLVGCLAATALSAQNPRFPEHPSGPDEALNKGSALLLNLHGGFHLPAGDMAVRFGPNGAAGLGFERLTANNWIFGVDGYYFFGNTVNEDPLTILRTDEGDIIGNDRLVASVVLRERGWYAGALVGRLIVLNGSRGGLRLALGAGWQQHKIRIQDDSRTVTQLTGDYLKGYDRLTGGFTLNEFIGWQSLGAEGTLNWFAGLELNQGFTTSLRDWDFSEQRKLDERRIDLRIGIRVGWTLPFWTGNASDVYY